MFKDRYSAAALLAKKLIKYKNSDGIVLAVPRGGVPIGYVVAKELNLPLELILSKKIGHPYNTEYAIGSVSLEGVVLDEGNNDVSLEYINSEIVRLRKMLKERLKLYSGNMKPTALKDKIVIIVDDGIATGYTIRATIEVLKNSDPRKIIIAIPVAPPATASALSELVDEFICLITPDDFGAIGRFYEDFSEVKDEEVIRLLRDANKLTHMA